MAVPIRVTKHNIRGTVHAMLVRGVKKTSEVRLNMQGIEIVSAGFHAPEKRRFIACVQRCLYDAVSGYILKAVVALAEIDKIRIGLAQFLVVAALDGVKTLSIRHTQWTQDKPIEDAEHYGIGANGQSQRQHGGDGESLRLAQLPKCIAEILQPIHDPTPGSLFRCFKHDEAGV